MIEDNFFIPSINSIDSESGSSRDSSPQSIDSHMEKLDLITLERNHISRKLYKDTYSRRVSMNEEELF